MIVYFKWKTSAIKIENIVRKGEITDYKQFLLSLYIFPFFFKRSIVRKNIVRKGEIT